MNRSGTTRTSKPRAFAAGLELHELVPRDVGLEDIFLRLVGDDEPAEVAEPHLEGGPAR